MPTPAPMSSIGPSEAKRVASGFAISPRNMGTWRSSFSPEASAAIARRARDSRYPDPTPVRDPPRQSSDSATVTATSIRRRHSVPLYRQEI